MASSKLEIRIVLEVVGKCPECGVAKVIGHGKLISLFENMSYNCSYCLISADCITKLMVRNGELVLVSKKQL